MKAKSLLVKLGLSGLSLTVALVACEAMARLALHPSDYLSVEMVPNDVLGAVPSGSTRAGGFDAWGFRNAGVPASSDIVAIGDSHTYGNGARMDDAWPAVVQELTGRVVYNMGLGGYGPNQYFELFKTRALRLKPRTIVCGLYMGDDFENAFSITYGLDHWQYLRELPPTKVNVNIWVPPELTPQKKARVWLSAHSLAYQLIVHGPVLGRFQGDVQIKNARQISPLSTTLSVPEKHILEAFLPLVILQNLNQGSDRVREGMRITFQLLSEMSEISRHNHIQFVVAVIPTKEMVFAEYLEHNAALPLNDTIDKLLANERIARDKTFSFLRGANIPYVDTLPTLRQSVDHELYARLATDMHPNRNGYRLIGQAVAFELEKIDSDRGESANGSLVLSQIRENH